MVYVFSQVPCLMRMIRTFHLWSSGRKLSVNEWRLIILAYLYALFTYVMNASIRLTRQVRLFLVSLTFLTRTHLDFIQFRFQTFYPKRCATILSPTTFYVTITYKKSLRNKRGLVPKDSRNGGKTSHSQQWKVKLTKTTMNIGFNFLTEFKCFRKYNACFLVV